ncbi:TetR family transcriptional regulator [Kitasatospora sp. NPDC048540]|uniref:TetR/AcrR family transcriptional regulator n=1 Tax=unclassified Kitasatospora TaxID=2633591 RepID=UPI00053B8FEB|nr:TetR/AcrR family transcriptional regulator [Kitasatospora sp. MBT63]
MANPTGARERIVAATLQIIGEDGVAAVTNRRIAKEADVSLGSITYHFATQHDLLRESLRFFVTQETCRFNDLAALSADRITLQEAGTLVRQVVADSAMDKEDIAPFELYLQAGRDPELREAAAECFEAYDHLATSILANLGVPEPHRLARAVVALVIGLQLRRMATGVLADDLVEALLLLIDTPA